MPWALGSDYLKQKNSELKYLLQMRSLAYTGNKMKMVARLVAYDNEHPFPFTKLPPEIRNEIYRLVSSFEEVWFYAGPNDRGRDDGEGDLCYESFINLTINSSLFCVSRQTRVEGLVPYYQHHHFLLSVEESGCQTAILLWLHNIGHVGRTNIRHIRILFEKQRSMEDATFMNSVRRMLSDKATIVYTAENAQTMWKIGCRFYLRDPEKAPCLTIHGVDHRRNSLIIDDTITDYEVTSPNWQTYGRCS